jgi:hypothetical protein
MTEIELARLHLKVQHAGHQRLGVPNIHCLCGETDPACFDKEHIGRRMLDGTVWGRCSNCHRKITMHQLMVHPGVGLAPDNRFRQMGHAFLGRYEYDQFNANFMLEAAGVMFKLADKGTMIED